MSDKKQESRLKYRAAPLTALVITLLSLFCQWVNWLAFDKLGYSWQIALITPLILCLMYHFVQLDAGREGSFSRGFFFVFAVVVPLIFGLLVTGIMILADPELSLFDPSAEYKGSVQEAIATFSGRAVLTSLYLAVFALIDIPLLKLQEGRSQK
ncbi:MAG: hypothetical protein IJ071_00555 [Ruminococcus sp.]|nr:hypothetical protein [Ruminococcus sp.]